MNTGAISVRYANALLKLTRESGRGEQVCAQVQEILANPDALANLALEADLEALTALLLKNGRLDMVRFIFSSFVKMYYRSAGIKPATLVTATPQIGLAEKLTTLLEKQTGCKVVMDCRTDSSLIGGFTLEVDDNMLDASVSREIEILRRQFANQNKRIL